MTLLSPHHNREADECIAHIHIPTLEEKLRASEAFSKDVLVAAHMAALHDAYILEMGTHPVDESPPTAVSPSTSLGGMKPILLKELKVGKVHRHRVLHGTLCVKTLCMKTLNTHVVVNVLEDEEGNATTLCLSDALPENCSTAQAQRLYPQGSQVAVREPYLTRLVDGQVGILVEKLADLMFLWVPEAIDSTIEAGKRDGGEKTSTPNDVTAPQQNDVALNTDYNGNAVTGDDVSENGAKDKACEDIQTNGHHEDIRDLSCDSNTKETDLETDSPDLAQDKVELSKGEEATRELRLPEKELEQPSIEEQAAESQLGKEAVEKQVEQEDSVEEQAAETQLGNEAVKKQVEPEDSAEEQAAETQLQEEAQEDSVEEQAVKTQLGREAVEKQVEQEDSVEEQAAETQLGEEAVDGSSREFGLDDMEKNPNIGNENQVEDGSLDEQDKEIQVGKDAVEKQVEQEDAVEEQAAETQLGKEAVGKQVEQEDLVEEQVAESQLGKEGVEKQVEQEDSVEEQAAGTQLGKEAVNGFEEASRELRLDGMEEKPNSGNENQVEDASLDEQEKEVQIGKEAVEKLVEQEDSVEEQAAETQLGKEAVEKQVEQEDLVEEQAAETQLGKEAVEKQVEQEEVEEQAAEAKEAVERPELSTENAMEAEKPEEVAEKDMEGLEKSVDEERLESLESGGEEEEEGSGDLASVESVEVVESKTVPSRMKPEVEEEETCASLRVKGNRFFGRGEYVVAAEMYSRSIQRARREDDEEEVLLGLSNRAEVWLRLHRNEMALEDSEGALGVKAGHLKSLFRKGRALMGLHRYQEALGILKEVHQRAPSDKELKEAMAKCSSRVMTGGERNKPAKKKRASALKKKNQQQHLLP